jgi:hypothetical protein
VEKMTEEKVKHKDLEESLIKIFGKKGAINYILGSLSTMDTLLHNFEDLMEDFRKEVGKEKKF